MFVLSSKRENDIFTDDSLLSLFDVHGARFSLGESVVRTIKNKATKPILFNQKYDYFLYSLAKDTGATAGNGIYEYLKRVDVRSPVSPVCRMRL